MSWRVRRAANGRGHSKFDQSPPARSVAARPKRTRRLSLEGLEERTVLAGLVNIEIFPNNADGFLTLTGDGSNNQVEIRQTANPNEFHVSSPDSTLFQINGAGVTVPEATINGIVNQIAVNLGDGNDNFSFLGIDDDNPSNVPANLEIMNQDGSNTNLVSNVIVNGDLRVTKAGGSSGYAELRIVNSTVIGDTIIDNFGGGTGDSRTVVDNSSLHAGGGDRRALWISNAEGNNITEVQGQSQLGTGSFLDPTDPIVSINNSGGGSRTSFTGAGQVAGPGTTTVYGKLEINNGTNLPGLLDIVTFNSTNVLGHVMIHNGHGDTESVVTDTTLGSHLVVDDPQIGGPVEIRNENGFDSLRITDSTMPWGLFVDNAYSSPDTNWGSDTTIINSSIGEHPFGPTLDNDGDALQIIGDNAKDEVLLDQTRLGGTLNLSELYNGNNVVSILNSSAMAALYFQGGIGDDTVTIDNSQIVVAVEIMLDQGEDTLTLSNVDLVTQWPDPLLGLIDIDGGDGVDTTNTDALLAGALGFEEILP